MKIKIDWYWFALIVLALCLFLKQCSKEPKTIVKTEYVKVTDTITKTIIDTVPKLVYVEKTKTIKGKDSIVYKDKPTDTSITANQYNTTLESNNASADLKITTTGELLDVKGTINYTKEIKTIKQAQSGLFLYGDVPITKPHTNVELGLIYQFKNSILIKGGAQYNNFTKGVDFKVGIGIKL